MELSERLERIKTSDKPSSSLTPTTVPDHSGNLGKRLKLIEHQRRRSLQLCVLRLLWLKVTLNPGYKVPEGYWCAKRTIHWSHGWHTSVTRRGHGTVDQRDGYSGIPVRTWFKTVRRILVLEAPKGSVAYLESTVELPKISVPNFYGDLLNWAVFLEQFETAIRSHANSISLKRPGQFQERR